MYGDAFCKIYNEFGWNYFPEAFGEMVREWIKRNGLTVKTCMDLACGTGVLCEVLKAGGIQSSGMDFSDAMIKIARERDPEIPYEVADMITFRPEKQFDLVTCTGDSLNHILHKEDLDKIFANVYTYLAPGGHFIFNVLNQEEVPLGEPIDLDWSEGVKAQFTVTQDQEGVIRLQTCLYENGELQFTETITETVHDPRMLTELLEKNGLEVIRRSDRLMDDQPGHGTTCFIIARKPAQ